ncbi:hypothetical protein SNOG_07501 [Parastagonospora nodorum SN15]|uniref:Uncharacterized protein n=2 Tax=Phaeosphaeria nodorum (strain SN15 / ATCC MYA-4574 / FGSC 10173) TaxID=321614 RepID=A0A7U2EWX9_PHANO|nr:hypothetical protein SNOG_07501 [Parastagonospora nodorum SN15]EAT84967.1 hypothetical protein SNOG_07501 [Parastagonospora nodorum SN15]QRC94237.1 hypothetical protein JI435_075010 [Parastagonospora nodorum SN15]
MASTDATAEREERLKSALWYTIGQYIDEECLTSDLNATPQFIGALTELVYTQIGILNPHHQYPPYLHHPLIHIQANTSHDLEVFAKHAGRKAINTDDVMLLTRRNDALESMLKGELERMQSAEGRGDVGGGEKKKGRPVGKGKGKAKA